MDTEVRKLIAKVEAQRREAMDLLLSLTDEQLALPYTNAPQGEEGPFTIRRVLHRIETHHRDHIQHLLKVRRNIGKPVDETTRALIEMQAARAEMIASLIGLSDDDLRIDVSEGNALGNLQPRAGQEPEYTIKRIVEHVVDMEEMRLGHIRQALEGGAR
ncbi:MAG: DinB family protein [Chloroflexi bacterium]|nr:DinB family protein [Chloroflexota bacterium]